MIYQSDVGRNCAVHNLVLHSADNPPLHPDYPFFILSVESEHALIKSYSLECTFIWRVPHTALTLQPVTNK